MLNYSNRKLTTGTIQNHSHGVDGYEAYRLTKAYICTGDETWTLKIENPPLRLLMLLMQEVICVKLYQARDKGELMTHMIEAAEGMNITEKTQNCLWKEVKVSLEAAFCEEDSHLTLETTIKLFTVSWCSHFPDKTAANIVCKIGDFLTEHVQEIKRFVQKYACAVYQTNRTAQLRPRVKRQYDLSSMVELINQLACIHPESVDLILKESSIDWLDLNNKKKVKAVRKTVLPFVCCMIDFVRESEGIKI